MTFLAAPVSQFDTGPLGSVNCGPAIAEGLILMGSVGALRVPARKIREEIGGSGGTTSSQLATATNKLTDYRYPLAAMKASGREYVRDLLETTSLGIIINCRVTVSTKYRTNGFTGLHWWRVGGGTLKDKTYKVEDPGTTHAGWFRVPRDLMFDAAEAAGGLFILRGVRTEDIDRQAVKQGVRVFAKPTRDSKVVRRLDKGETVHVKRTTKGGPWTAADGRVVHGWHEIPAGFVKGEALR